MFSENPFLDTSWFQKEYYFNARSKNQMWKIYLPERDDKMFIELDSLTMTKGSSNCEKGYLQILDPNGGFTSRKMCPDREW